jgi:YHS domain-containing protein
LELNSLSKTSPSKKSELRGGESGMVKDPVCKMDVNEKTAKLKSDYNGKTYYFCAAGCKSTFEKTPSKYIK